MIYNETLLINTDRWWW